MNIISCLQETVSHRQRYLGGDCIQKLECFAYGYMEALRYNGIVEQTGPPMEPFLMWLAFYKYGKEWESGWSTGWGHTLINKFDGDNDKAFAAFKDLLDEYASFEPIRRASIPVPAGGGGAGMHLRFTRENARIPKVVDVFQLLPHDFCYSTYTYERDHREINKGVYKNVQSAVLGEAKLLGIEVSDWKGYQCDEQARRDETTG